MTVSKIKCIDDEAYKTAASKQAGEMSTQAAIDLAIQVGMYVAERTIFSNITDMKRDLANRRLSMARQVVEHINHARPTEGAFVAEIMATPKAEPVYSRAEAASSAASAFAVNARRRIDAELLRIGAEGRGACFDNRTLRSLALAGIDLTAYTMRTEEARANKLNERRVSQQLSVIALGKGLLVDALRIGQIGESANAVVAGTLIESMNAAGALFSYVNNRFRMPEGWDPVKSAPPRVVKPGEVMVETIDPRTGNPTYNVMQEDAYKGYRLSNEATQGEAQRQISRVEDSQESVNYGVGYGGKLNLNRGGRLGVGS